MTAPLMPKATAVWLVENTTLTFRQIAFFCELHELEVQAIADGDIAYNIVGMNPITTGQLTWEEIRRCEANPRELLQASEMERNVKARNLKTKKVLSPSQRADKPAAILWVLKNYPEIIDSQICKLIGTTKSTIDKIRNGEYKDAANLRPKNPVAVGLCSEKDLENALKISRAYNEPKPKKKKTKKTAKKAVKKVVAKKAKAEKAPAKKNAVKKTPAKKKPAKAKTKAKAEAVKKEAKKTADKPAAKKAVAKKAESKVKKAAVKKAPAKKAAVKKAEPKAKKTVKAPAKAKAVKKTTVKTVKTAKATAKVKAEKAPKAEKKAAVKKPVAKKPVTKKASAKKPAVKKTAAKKPAAKKAK
ncbi:MAG: DUF1013 domain-containing protein [Lactobacillaceae bacterium]|jgi:hypothetical protein|nr:DUF1013 domain-containing protein [Lactobacillaceae bacterium]